MRGSLLTSTDRSWAFEGRSVGGADGRAVERALWAVVLASVALDVATTWLGLSMGLVEANPAMRWAIEGVGFGALVAAKALAVGGAMCLRAARPRHGTAIALGLALPWTVTVLVNAVVLASV
ncbi:DUF5658 family protein [Halosimplex aquaticum]|uniref:DUF5658 family protein n=1 Tax=Halosimplex aquaticum TaxID=3026162 RepID=A0ABD5XZY7_9EURY|nr:DUF5658 family protein [Halosimplex aquaticum]